MDTTIRVVVVDDSAFMRRALTRLISEGRGFEVVGTACNGREALTVIRELKPDVVTLDIEMPEMDGLQTLEALMVKQPVPVVMFSSLTLRGAEVTLRCLELGAVDFIAKPSGSVSEDLSSIRYIIWQKLRSAAGAHLCVGSTAITTRPPVTSPLQPLTKSQSHIASSRVVAIGASTGGPRALQEVLSRLPASLPASLLVVQHMPPHFTEAMARRFDANCALTIREAQVDDPIEDGVALVAPGGRHMRVAATRRIELTDEPPLWGVRPAVDHLLETVAAVYHTACLGVILTGMGRDGTQGAVAVKAAGGRVIVQDEATCVVYGMPRSAAEAGVVDQILPVHEIAGVIEHWCQTTTLRTV